MTLNNAYSKALEPGCLFRFYAPPFDYDTVSRRRMGENTPFISHVSGEEDFSIASLLSLFSASAHSH
jgi:hypothetical protein